MGHGHRYRKKESSQNIEEQDLTKFEIYDDAAFKLNEKDKLKNRQTWDRTNHTYRKSYKKKNVFETKFTCMVKKTSPWYGPFIYIW